MKKILVLFTLVILSDCGWATDHIVKMLNKDGSESMVFKPSVLTIEKGDKVTFIPESKDHNTRSIYKPNEAKDWTSKTGEKVTITFDVEGTYIYECSNHRIMAMFGVIQVGKKYNKNKVQNFIQDYKKRIPLNKKRYDEYFAELNSSMN